jgi:ankyrin repeat protein
VDRTNRLGETALIAAVQQRQMPVIRRLLEAGASPDKTDNATGRSARDYAKLDTRGAEMIRLMDTVKGSAPKPAAGPRL